MTQTEHTSNAISNSPDVELSNDAITPAHAGQPVDAVEIAPSGDAGEFGGAVDTSLKDMIDTGEVKRALEAALLAASEPMGLNELRRLFEGQLGPEVIRNLLDALRTEWDDRSIELAVVASGYRFRVKPVYQKYLDRLSSDKPLKYSRAVMETLAIIAYRQPVTRGDIEDIRGVAVSPHILKTLEDRGWIDEIGNRDTVGRPALFATTKHFLDDLNLRSLEELPPLHELQATLDMTQTGVALAAGESPFPPLPGVQSARDFMEAPVVESGDATDIDVEQDGSIDEIQSQGVIEPKPESRP
ncbi:MAG: SMC-Scp complex subunit ScpB [Burkholderiales bacterium]